MNERTKKALEDLKRISDDYGGEIASVATSAAAVISELSYRMNRWIPIKTRPMTKEEKEDLRETEWYDELYELEEVLDCPMPDDGQEVWITIYGRVERDVYHNDFHGCYFEDWEISDVTAWMPGPEEYREREG